MSRGVSNHGTPWRALRVGIVVAAVILLGFLFHLNHIVATTEHQPTMHGAAQSMTTTPPPRGEADQLVIEPHADTVDTSHAHLDEDITDIVSVVVPVEPMPEPWQIQPSQTALPPGYVAAWEVEQVPPDLGSPAPPAPSDPGPPSVAEATDVITDSQ